MINTLLYQILASIAHGKIQEKSYKNDKLKISAPTWKEKIEFPNGSYSVPDIQGYFKYIIKTHETVIDNPPIRIYVNKIENRITLRINTGIISCLYSKCNPIFYLICIYSQTFNAWNKLKK